MEEVISFTCSMVIGFRVAILTWFKRDNGSIMHKLLRTKRLLVILLSRDLVLNPLGALTSQSRLQDDWTLPI